MLRIHPSQNRFSLSNPPLDKTYTRSRPDLQFVRLTLSAPISEDSTTMRFRHPLGKHRPDGWTAQIVNGRLQRKGLSLRQGAEATSFPRQVRRKITTKSPTSEYLQTKEGNRNLFVMKAYIRADE